jgi:hypothetical protein
VEWFAKKKRQESRSYHWRRFVCCTEKWAFGKVFRRSIVVVNNQTGMGCIDQRSRLSGALVKDENILGRFGSHGLSFVLMVDGLAFTQEMYIDQIWLEP